MSDDEIKKLAPDETWPMIYGESFFLNEKWTKPSEVKWPTDEECISEMKEAIGSFKKKQKVPLENILESFPNQKFKTIMADPPWQFQNRTGKMAPEHKRLNRYQTMRLDDIMCMPVGSLVAETAHLYLWVPNALLPEGLRVMEAWGFQYKSNLIWHKIRKDGGSDGRGVGFYFRNVTEILLFGVRGKNARTLSAGRRQVNLLATQKREHSRKPDEMYDIIEACSPDPYLELFARGKRNKWSSWGNEVETLGTDDKKRS